MYDVEIAVQWLAYASRLPVDVVRGLGLTESQIVCLAVGLSRNGLLNPPRGVYKLGRFTCQCGCGEVFERWYRTRKPRYVDRAHQQRVYRRRRQARC